MSDWKLLNTSTASGASSVSFTDLTGYKIFKFVFIDVNPATDGVQLRIGFSSNGGSSYGMTKTTTFFYPSHGEGGSSWFGYSTSQDLAQSTTAQDLTTAIGNGSDECAAGELHLFNPTSTTYVKHFYSRANTYQYNDYSQNEFVAGYVNDTSAVNAVEFSVTSGNFDGVIKQYGLVST
tara:strand:- start:4534 stop:5067 length:534 start_codon:yes stop_codon:yes gene_type:complete